MNEPHDPFVPKDEENEEVRIVPPDYTLKKIIGEDVDIKQLFSHENVEKAQAVINEHKDSFLEWVKKDIGQLQEYYDKAVADPAVCEAEIKKLAKAAFVIKSQAGTFGFTLATQIAKSLDDFCNKQFHPCPEHLMVISKHIETLIVIFRQNITGDGAMLGKELSDGLYKLVEKYKDK